MKACASLPAAAPALSRSNYQPVVFVNGVPETRLIARELRVNGPLDRRSGLLAMTSVENTAILLDHWKKATVTLSLPNRLVDEQVRWPVFVHGRLAEDRDELSATSDEQILTLVDRWDLLLDEPLTSVWWQTDEGLLFDEAEPAVMRVGDGANRSQLAWEIVGEQIHVFQNDGDLWTLGTALATVSALAGLELSLNWLTAELRNLPLVQEIDLGQATGRVLRRILEPYGLVIQRDLVRESATVIERRSVRPAMHGRAVRLAWADDQRPLGQVLSVIADRPPQAAQPWIVRAEGWLVESTFELVNGWDPALEGEPDSSYSKVDNGNFSTYANVFRLWALNEDGQFSNPPYNQGDAYDLAAFFQHFPIRPRLLRFLPALTLDDAGVRRSPIVEISTDNGSNWSVYPGSARVRTDRAAVYLDDTTLPSAFLAAAQLGIAKVRITASLRSPIPVEVLRWSGNPFAGTNPAKVFDLGDAFRFQRVAPGSIHFTSIQSGTIKADEINQTATMNNWLINRQRRADELVDDEAGKATLKLSGTWPLLRIGDRLINTSGLGFDASGHAEAIASKGAVVSSVRCRWSDGLVSNGQNRTRSGNRAPMTVVEVNF